MIDIDVLNFRTNPVEAVGPKEGCLLHKTWTFKLFILGQYSVGKKRHILLWEFD